MFIYKKMEKNGEGIYSLNQLFIPWVIDWLTINQISIHTNVYVFLSEYMKKIHCFTNKKYGKNYDGICSQNSDNQNRSVVVLIFAGMPVTFDLKIINPIFDENIYFCQYQLILSILKFKDKIRYYIMQNIWISLFYYFNK